MAQYDNLTECFTDMADAIREIQGSGGGTPKIAPTEFASEIRKLATRISITLQHGDSFTLSWDSPGTYYFSYVSGDDPSGELAFTSGGHSEYATLRFDEGDYAYVMVISRASYWYTIGWFLCQDGNNDFPLGMSGQLIVANSGDLTLSYRGASSMQMDFEGVFTSII